MLFSDVSMFVYYIVYECRCAVLLLLLNVAAAYTILSPSFPPLSSCTELNIHGLGAAIHRAINLALQIRETSSVPMEISATTATVELQDELEPLDDVITAWLVWFVMNANH